MSINHVPAKIPPPAGSLKCYIDTIFFANLGFTAIGVCIRDEDSGQWINNFFCEIKT